MSLASKAFWDWFDKYSEEWGEDQAPDSLVAMDAWKAALKSKKRTKSDDGETK